MTDRRRLQDQLGEAADVLTERPTKRDRSWEAEQREQGIVVTYRGIPRGLQERIKEIAGEHKVNIGELARRFLEYALDAYEDGSLVLEPEEKAEIKRTLYPDE